MAAFPPDLKILFDTSEAPAPVVIRSEMERGVPKQRRTAADALVTVPISVIFFTKQQAADFETWFSGEINAGVDFFDWTDPRTGALREARIVGGQLGELIPLRESYNMSRRSMTLEYVRRGFEVLAPGRYDISPSRILSVQSDAGTYIDGSGVMQTAPANTARYEGGLLVVEGASENTASRSQEFDQWTKSDLAVQADAGLAPDGTTTADRLIPNTNVAAHNAYRSGTAGSFPIGQILTLSVFVKRSTGVRYSRVSSLSSQCSGIFDLDTASVVSTGGGVVAAGVIPLHDGWFRVWATCNLTVVAGVRLYVAAREVSNSDFFAGDGTSGHLVWGGQVELGPLTSYIPTATTAITRAADIINVAV